MKEKNMNNLMAKGFILNVLFTILGFLSYGGNKIAMSFLTMMSATWGLVVGFMIICLILLALFILLSMMSEDIRECLLLRSKSKDEEFSKILKHVREVNSGFKKFVSTVVAFSMAGTFLYFGYNWICALIIVSHFVAKISIISFIYLGDLIKEVESKIEEIESDIQKEDV
jgi:hypothetical protein